MKTIKKRVHDSRTGRGDRGSVSLLFVVAVAALFVLMGLVVDGGGKLNASSRATALAQEAARAGGQQLDPGKAIKGQDIVVDPEAAAAAAKDYLADAGATGDVTVSADGTELTVTVNDTYHPYFASVLGVDDMPVTATGTAQLHTTGG